MKERKKNSCIRNFNYRKQTKFVHYTPYCTRAKGDAANTEIACSELRRRFVEYSWVFVRDLY